MPLEIYKRYDYEAINNLTLVTSLHFTRSTSISKDRENRNESLYKKPVLAKLFTLLHLRQLPKSSFCIITQFLPCFLCFLPNVM